MISSEINIHVDEHYAKSPRSDEKKYWVLRIERTIVMNNYGLYDRLWGNCVGLEWGGYPVKNDEKITIKWIEFGSVQPINGMCSRLTTCSVADCRQRSYGATSIQAI